MFREDAQGNPFHNKVDAGFEAHGHFNCRMWLVYYFILLRIFIYCSGFKFSELLILIDHTYDSHSR